MNRQITVVSSLVLEAGWPRALRSNSRAANTSSTTASASGSIIQTKSRSISSGKPPEIFAPVQRASIHGGVFWPIHSSFLTFQDHIQWYHDTKEICAKYGLEVIQASLYAHPWDLSLLLGYFGQPTDEMREKDSKARYELVQRAVDMGGAADAIHGAGLKSAYFFEQQLGPVGAELLKKIKDVMDPNHTLNPGKRWKAVEDQRL